MLAFVVPMILVLAQKVMSTTITCISSLFTLKNAALNPAPPLSVTLTPNTSPKHSCNLHWAIRTQLKKVCQSLVPAGNSTHS